MKILATQYSLATKSLDIYIAGCSGPHCPGCHNPESWSFDQGESWAEAMRKIWSKFESFRDMIDSIMVFGGEPLDQDRDELATFLSYLANLDARLWLFTGKRPLDVPDFVKEYCDFIKCGRYDKDQTTIYNVQHGVALASANQQIFKKGEDYV